MRKRIAIISAVAAIGLSTLSFGPSFTMPASAAPITCPAGQTVTKTGPGTWECVNKGGGGNPSTEETKNPND
jgi:hypothetical protein